MVADMSAEQYDMSDGTSVFMSRKTRKSLDDSLFVSGKPRIANLEMPLNFERFNKAKTVLNVTEWMQESVSEASLKSSDFNHLAADGGSNAIGSVQEFEVVTRVEDGRSNSIDFSVCFTHQNERSAKYASGTGGFAHNPNPDLGEVLDKSHTIQTRLNGSGERKKVYETVQVRNEREPQIGPDPANLTRWSGTSTCDTQTHHAIANNACFHFQCLLLHSIS